MSCDFDQNSEQKKVMLYTFQEKEWVEACVGQLHVLNKERAIELDVGEKEGGKLPSFLGEHGEQRSQLCRIGLEKVTGIDPDDSDSRIIYVWIENNPLSLSFLDSDYCSQVREFFNQHEQKLSSQQKLNTLLQVPDDDDKINRINWATDFLKKMKFYHQAEVNDGLWFGDIMGVYFEHLKNFIIKCNNQQELQLLISDDNFKTVLYCLKFNPFNDKKFDYYQQYHKLIKINNVLNIEDNVIVQSYKDNTKLKFLKDCVACMFLEIQADRTFQNLIGLNNLTILEKVSTSEKTLKSLIALKEENPVMYLNAFAELWDIFKVTTNDLEFKDIKDHFKNKFVELDLHTLSLEAMKNVLEGKQDNNPRFYQKWTEALTQFFYEEGKKVQNWILEQASNFCLGSILFKIVCIDDQSLKSTVLNFVSNLIQPGENKPPPTSRFIQYFYRTFVSKAYEEFNKSACTLEKYLKFLMKLYVFEPIRTRRVLIENHIILDTEKKSRNKYILISLIKMLRTIVEVAEPSIITYLSHHHCFEGLREQFQRNKNCQNVTYSCFLNLFKSIHQCENAELQKYMLDLFFPEEGF